MRLGLCVLVLGSLGGSLVGCTNSDDSGYYPPGGTQPTGCTADTDCSGSDVCARDGECLPPGDVSHVVATWTINGSAASDATCAGEPNLDIQFSTDEDYDDGVGFAPVPCNEGKFSVDKMPSRFTVVGLGNEATEQLQTQTLDGSGDVSFDLPSS